MLALIVFFLLLDWSKNEENPEWLLGTLILIAFYFTQKDNEKYFSFTRFFVTLTLCSWLCIFFDRASVYGSWFLVAALSLSLGWIRVGKHCYLTDIFSGFPRLFFLLTFGLFSSIFIWLTGSPDWPWISKWSWLSVILLSFVCTAIRGIYKIRSAKQKVIAKNRALK
ncbi:hypothetical protein [Pseudoalteromonas sp. T1lg75]|uniref:hypothetical protein n=1 Tax=Pseudoalteromonas sp. T1lg75 TaxID=2077102 RepID=UPI00131A2005|nr:hypothetical protein [Pseudoalteromonas sp. T1lg75]